MIKGLRFLATTFLIGSSYASLITSNEFGEMLKGDSREAIRTLYNAPMSNEEQANGISLTDAGKYFREFEDFVGKVIREADEQKDDNLIDMLSVLGCYKFDGTAYKTIIDIALYNRYVDKLVKTPEFKQMVEKAREKRAEENNIRGLPGKVNAKNAKEGLKHEIKEFVHQYQNENKRKLRQAETDQYFEENKEFVTGEGLCELYVNETKKTKEERKDVYDQKLAKEKADREKADKEAKIAENLKKFEELKKPKEGQSVEPTTGKERKGSFHLKPKGPTKEEVEKWKEKYKKEKPEVTKPTVTVGTVPPKVVEPKKEEIKKPVFSPAYSASRNLYSSMIFKPFSESKKPEQNYSSFRAQLDKENDLFKKLNEGNPSIQKFIEIINKLSDDEFKKFISNDFYGKVKSEIMENKHAKASVPDDANKRLCKLINEVPEDQVEDLLENVHPDIMNEFNKKEGGFILGLRSKERVDSLIKGQKKREIVKKFIDEKLNKTSKKLKKSKSEIFHPSEENKKSSDTFWGAGF